MSRILSFVILAAAALMVACGGPATAPSRPNLLLVTLDTLRADAVGCYGATTGATPHLDQLAARGVRFDRAWTVTPLTTPAHATLLTGVFPGTHGIRNNGRFRLPAEATTLAEVLAAEGYHTGAVVAAFPVQRMFGLDQGFADFDEDFGVDLEGKPVAQRRASAVNQRAVAWLEAATAGDRPWFLWVHYYDPHEPYEPPEPFASAHPGRPYDGEVAFADQALGNLLQVLAERGAEPNTVVVAAADHGEGLGDHGESTHGVLLYEPMVHVPLILAAPGRLDGGIATGQPASLADVMPTVLDLLGVDGPDGMQGVDLVPALRADAGDERRPLYAETFYPREEFGWAPLRALRVGDNKIILGPDVEWYDLSADPGEMMNRYTDDPDAADALARRLRAVAEDAEAGTLAADAAVTEESMEALAGLGYVGGGAGTGADPWDLSGRHPREAIADYEAFLEASDRIQEGHATEVIPVLEDLLERDPTNPQFLFKLAKARLTQGKLPQAEKDLRALIELHPAYYLAYRDLSSILEYDGRFEEALALWLRLDERGTAFVGADLRVASILMAMGRVEEARHRLEAHLSTSPDDPEALSLMAQADATLGRPADAEAGFRRALERNPSDVGAIGGLVDVLLRTGRFQEALPLLDRGLSLAPSNAEIRSRRALVLAQLGRLGEALDEAQGAAMIDPTSVSLQQNLGALLLEAGRLDEAESVFNRILGLDPDFLPARFSRGLVKMQRGDREGAVADLQEVLARDPQHPGARHFLTQLQSGD